MMLTLLAPVSFKQILMHCGAQPGQSLKLRKDLVAQTICALVKNSEDRREATEFAINRW
jgi:hypothetical protein